MFIYYNKNPNGYHMPDCVIRAISTALNMDYYKVINLLQYNADQMQCECLNVKCYEKLLDYDFKLPHYQCNNMTAQQVANDHFNNILLLRINGHLSCSIYGDIYDIWDCSNEIITDFWIVK